PPTVSRAARALIAFASIFVPRQRHDEWLEMWEAELAHVPPGPTRNRAAFRFAAGSIVHALWELQEALTMRQLGHDLRFAFRFLRRTPGFALVAILTLALGVGANATVFGLVNGLLLRPPSGIGGPEALVQIGRNREAAQFDNWSWPAYVAMRDGLTATYSGVAAYAATAAVIGRDLEARPVSAHLVSAEYFDVLRMPLVAGRGFVAEEGRRGGAAAVVVISHELFSREFRADPAAIGRALTVNGQAFTVVGVAPAGFRGADVFRAPADLFVPMSQLALLTGRPDQVLDEWTSSWVWVVGRLAPGVTAAQAQAATQTLLRAQGDAHPMYRMSDVQIVPGVGVRPAERGQVRNISAALLALSALVLLVACANLAGLALARATSRAPEFGIRLSLGASRWRLLRASAVESAVLGTAGAAVAVGLVAIVSPHLDAVLPPVAVGFEPDWRVLLFSLALGLVAGLAFALVPSVSATRQDPANAMRGAGRGSTGPGTRLRSVLVAGQLAVAFVVTTAALLLARTMHNVANATPGFDPRQVMTFALDPRLAREAGPAAVGAKYAELRDRARALPGVTAAGYAVSLPIADPQRNQSLVAPGDPPPPRGTVVPRVFINTVDSGYFAALRIPLTSGRLFGAADETGGGSVAIIDERLAAEHFPGADPVGRTLPFRVAGEQPVVVGVVAAHRTRSLADPAVPQVYFPIRSSSSEGLVLVLRTASQPTAIPREVAALLAQSGSGFIVRRAGPLSRLIQSRAAATQTAARFVSVFGVLSLLLSAIGLYGVLAYSVARRRTELGIRMALGAHGGRIVSLVLRQTGRIVIAGLLVGAGLSVAALGALRSLLYGVEPFEPLVFSATALLLAVVALLASAIPARRAASANATIVLRDP
ncbi:MAG TPA: ADOP family duplicated permease, partial [Gemmatimonadaceae bacterium]|nr:ADOP family duplicated permease [Gemmatimonadaceae bacterium]